MNKTEFVEQLRAIAEELKPLTQAASPGGATWNGTEYVIGGGEKKPDPYALAWWSTLLAVAELIDAQESPLSLKQFEYLEGILFGGMGSLNDLYFDPKIIGASADLINRRLDEKRHDLFVIFKN